MKKIVFIFSLLPMFFASCTKEVFEYSKNKNKVDYVELYVDGQYEGKFQFIYDDFDLVSEIIVFDKNNNLDDIRITYERSIRDKNLEIKQFDKISGTEHLASHQKVFVTNKIDSIIVLTQGENGDKIIYNYRNSKLFSYTYFIDGDKVEMPYLGGNPEYLEIVTKDNHDFMEWESSGGGLLGNTIDNRLISKINYPNYTIDYSYVLNNDCVIEKEMAYTIKTSQEKNIIKYKYTYSK